MVIAIFISAIMFAIGYRTLSQAMNDRDALKTSQERITEIQGGMRIIAQDFAQIAARPARDLQGAGDLQAALVAPGTTETLLTFYAHRLEQSLRSAAPRRATRALSLRRWLAAA